MLVPHIVRSCVEEIERRGLKEEGIYRISGASTEIQALKHAFNTSECVCAGAQLHICSGVCKILGRITLQIGAKVLVCLAESAGKDGEPHLQDDIRREELDGECRDATEEEAEERSYPEDPSDWPAPHQITGTFR